MKTAAALLSLGLLAPCLAAPTTAQDQASKVAFGRERQQNRKRADGSVDPAWLMGTLKDTVRKYNKDMQLPDVVQNGPKKRDTDANLPLTDQVNGGSDVLYYGKGTVGSQTFTFDFDTGSSDTFVPGPSCGTDQGCVGNIKYSQTGKDQGNTTSITYGSGQVKGENYLDSLTVAGLTATNQNIISLTDSQGFANSASDGLVGMAFPAIANSKEVSKIIYLQCYIWCILLGVVAWGTGGQQRGTFLSGAMETLLTSDVPLSCPSSSPLSKRAKSPQRNLASTLEDNNLALHRTANSRLVDVTRASTLVHSHPSQSHRRLTGRSLSMER